MCDNPVVDTPHPRCEVIRLNQEILELKQEVNSYWRSEYQTDLGQEAPYPEAECAVRGKKYKCALRLNHAGNHSYGV